MQDGPDPLVFTSGHWLHRDAQQRDARTLDFDFNALCKKVVELCPGSRQVETFEKAESGFNRVFLFLMDNGTGIVARIPFRIAGPAGLTTNSEVATMAYMRKHTNIPVPEVLDWSDSNTNVIGVEYIIMKYVPGVQLRVKWSEMTPLQHRRCVSSLSKMMKSMSALSFSGYGSIYFADAAIDHTLKIPLGEFCLGPVTSKDYWNCIPWEPRYYENQKQKQGPWRSLDQYLDGLLDQGLSRIPSSNKAPKIEPLYCGTVQEHHRLLDISKAVLKTLGDSPLLQAIATPTLLHPDLYQRNIFVSEDDPTIITSIIDWQSTCVEPAFVVAIDTPDLVNRNSVPESIRAITDQDDTAEDPEEDPKAIEERKRPKQMNVPTLSKARNADQNLLRPLRYCGTSWRDGAAATRQELIELSKKWTEIGLPGACPYQPSAKELEEHTLGYDQFEMKQGLKDLLIEMHDTNGEGWIHSDDWQAAKEAHREIYEWWVNDAEQSEEPGISGEPINKCGHSISRMRGLSPSTVESLINRVRAEKLICNIKSQNLAFSRCPSRERKTYFNIACIQK
ncbi:Protein kinase-like (PK-like) [Glarea lozoyensis ATCC 20868]|uniref:Altered inheritance of mitochondria protein 9, mitochondrial n=1 Tax=Glarea lozoyensis (strain ATCC 20868 / MF5171) TaxID=1116229 RepID=S3D0I5_GLAL2|nr:Protein kinase-like (PK-like) [Glarea lozoyensis ATCC 20868]EPE30674.1 Protein kinase-like (PK-like) [Glarea lozoyensis ATCC 20868]